MRTCPRMPLPLAGGTPEEVPELEEGGVSDGDTRLNGAGCPFGAQADARRISRQRARVGFIWAPLVRGLAAPGKCSLLESSTLWKHTPHRGFMRLKDLSIHGINPARAGAALDCCLDLRGEVFFLLDPGLIQRPQTTRLGGRELFLVVHQILDGDRPRRDALSMAAAGGAAGNSGVH